MMWRRTLLAAAGTVAAGPSMRKLRAEAMRDVSAGLVPTDPPVPAPDLAFITADGNERHLKDFVGRGMVINLWATWCVPCVAEMPALEALSRRLAPDDIAVLPLSSDRGGRSAVETFYREHGITSLPLLLDPKGAAARLCGARGIPTSLIVDTRGRERARLEGAADWSTPEAAMLVRKLAATE